MTNDIPADIERILASEQPASEADVQAVKAYIKDNDRAAYAVLTDSRLSRFLRLNNDLIQSMNAGRKL